MLMGEYSERGTRSLSKQETWPGAGDLIAVGDVATAREGDLTQLKIKLTP